MDALQDSAIYKLTITMTDDELERIKEECARIETPEWQYRAGWSCARIDSFTGVRSDSKLNDPEISESWKRGYRACWHLHKLKVALAMRRICK